MAKIKGNVLGINRGKVGEVLFRKWRGQYIAGSMPTQMGNPNTLAQQIQRAKLSAMSKFARGFATGAAIGLKPNYKGTALGWRNYFSKLNWDELDATLAPSQPVTIDLTKVRLSTGAVPAPSFQSPVFDQGLTLEVSYNADSGVPGTDSKDLVYLFAYQADLNQGLLGEPSQRSEGTAGVKCPAAWSGMKVHLYGFCVKSKDDIDSQTGITIFAKGDTSVTTYLGSGNLE